jgi:hypothetical protein
MFSPRTLREDATYELRKPWGLWGDNIKVGLKNVVSFMKMTGFWVTAPCSLVEVETFLRCLMPPST